MKATLRLTKIVRHIFSKRRISQSIGPMLPVPFIVVDEENKRCFRKRYVGGHNSRPLTPVTLLSLLSLYAKCLPTS